MLDEDVDRNLRGDFAGVVAAHAVRDDAETEIFVNSEAVFVARPDRPFIGDTERAQH
jgi:hypothetical protein